MNYNKSYKVGQKGVLLGMFLTLLGIGIKVKLIVLIGIIMAIASALLKAIFYRCPDCNSSLSRRGGKPKHCPECGYKLNV